MKVLILALWASCTAGPPDHAIIVPDLETCERWGPVVTQTLRVLGEGQGWEFQCRFQEEPAEDPERCYMVM